MYINKYILLIYFNIKHADMYHDTDESDKKILEWHSA